MSELAKKFLDNQDYFTTGLCAWNYQLYVKGIITLEEKRLVLSKILNFGYKNNIITSGEYIWKEEELQPRINWIKENL